MWNVSRILNGDRVQTVDHLKFLPYPILTVDQDKTGMKLI